MTLSRLCFLIIGLADYWFDCLILVAPIESTQLSTLLVMVVHVNYPYLISHQRVLIALIPPLNPNALQLTQVYLPIPITHPQPIL